MSTKVLYIYMGIYYVRKYRPCYHFSLLIVSLLLFLVLFWCVFCLVMFVLVVGLLLLCVCVCSGGVGGSVLFGCC